jgi:hypothetical protein
MVCRNFDREKFALCGWEVRDSRGAEGHWGQGWWCMLELTYRAVEFSHIKDGEHGHQYWDFV